MSGEVLAAIMADQEVAAQRARAMDPGVVRAVAFLHGAAPRLPYRRVFRLVADAEEIRGRGRPGSQDGMVLRFLTRQGLDAATAMGVLDILRRPPAPKPIRVLFPEWAGLSAEVRALAWQQWRLDPAPVRWVS